MTSQESESESGTDQLTAEQRLARNPVRLYNDAGLLHRNSRYPSAIALAILAIEEVGKLRVVQAKRLLPEINWKARAPLRHHDKQSAFLLQHWNLAYNEALADVCKGVAGEREWQNARGHTDWEKTEEFLVEGCFKFLAAKTALAREHIVGIFNSISEAVDKRLYDHPFGYLYEIAENKLIDRQKQNAFYLDLDSAGDVETDPADLGDEDAGLWMSVAEIAVEGLFSEEKSMAAARRFIERFAFQPGRKPFQPSPPMTMAEYEVAFAKMAQSAGIRLD